MSVQNIAETHTLTKNNRPDFQTSEIKASSRKWRAFMPQNIMLPFLLSSTRNFDFCVILPNESNSVKLLIRWAHGKIIIIKNNTKLLFLKVVVKTMS